MVLKEDRSSGRDGGRMVAMAAQFEAVTERCSCAPSCHTRRGIVLSWSKPGLNSSPAGWRGDLWRWPL